MKKIFRKEVLVLLFSMTALICATVSLNNSLNQLVEEEQDDDME